MSYLCSFISAVTKILYSFC